MYWTGQIECKEGCLCVWASVWKAASAYVFVFGLPTYTLKDLFTKSILLRNQIRKAFGVTLAVQVQTEGTVWQDGGERSSRQGVTDDQVMNERWWFVPKCKSSNEQTLRLIGRQSSVSTSVIWNDLETSLELVCTSYLGYLNDGECLAIIKKAALCQKKLPEELSNWLVPLNMTQLHLW